MPFLGVMTLVGAFTVLTILTSEDHLKKTVLRDLSIFETFCVPHIVHTHTHTQRYHSLLPTTLIMHAEGQKALIWISFEKNIFFFFVQTQFKR